MCLYKRVLTSFLTSSVETHPDFTRIRLLFLAAAGGTVQNTAHFCIIVVLAQTCLLLRSVHNIIKEYFHVSMDFSLAQSLIHRRMNQVQYTKSLYMHVDNEVVDVFSGLLHSVGICEPLRYTVCAVKSGGSHS